MIVEPSGLDIAKFILGIVFSRAGACLRFLKGKTNLSDSTLPIMHKIVFSNPSILNLCTSSFFSMIQRLPEI